MMHFNRRQMAGLFAGLVLAAGLINPAAAQPVRGGALVAATDIEPSSLDPIFGSAPSLDGNIYNLIFEKLFFLDPQGTMQPQLAESWEFAEDQLSITFYLRSGVTFHDGTPFNAAAVKFSLDRAIDASLGAPHTEDLQAIASVEIVDDTTVRVNLKSPSGAVIAGLANEAGSILSPAALEAQGDGFARNPVGTGPFKFVEWRGGDRIVVEANPDYWRTDANGEKLPYLGGVTVRFIANTAVKILEAQSGSVHLVDTVQVKDFEAIESAENLELIDKPTGVHQWMAFNVTKPPFDNKDLRLAVLHAIDRVSLEKVVSRGYGAITPTLIAPSDWAYDGELQYPAFDVELAKQHLAASGFDGAITISVIQRDPDTQIAQVLQAMLGQAGIQVKVEILERQAWLDKVLAYNHEIGLLRINVPRTDPNLIFASQMGRDAGANFSGYKNEDLYAAIEAGANTLDQAERRGHYIEAQQILLDDLPYGFLFLAPVKDIASTALEGLKRESSGAWDLSEAYLAQ
jgi:peptide/nickel transport system substrate-binding protein